MTKYPYVFYYQRVLKYDLHFSITHIPNYYLFKIRSTYKTYCDDFKRMRCLRVLKEFYKGNFLKKIKKKNIIVIVNL